MEREDKKIITTNEAAEVLNVKPSTIHKYVREKKVKPVYEDNWHIDSTKLFYLDDVLNLKKQFEKPGITTGEAAELLGLSPASVSVYIQKGELKAEKKLYKGREIYFVEPEDLESFKSKYEESKKSEKKDFYNKQTGYAWFQSFKDRYGQIKGRIIPDENEQLFLLVDNEKIAIEEIRNKGYSPVQPIKEIGYIPKKGFAKFLFSETPTEYKILEIFYKYLGPKNMKMSLSESGINVEVKPIIIKQEISDSLYDVLEQSLVEGSVSRRGDMINIDSELEILSVPVPGKLKQRIKEQAKESNSTMEEIVVSILNEKYGLE